MDSPRIIIRPPGLLTEVRVGRDLSRIHAYALGEWLDAVAYHTANDGEPAGFDHPIALPLLRETDTSGTNGRTVSQAKRFFLNRLGNTAPSEPRSIQVVFTDSYRDARWNEGVRGTLWGSIEHVPGKPELLRGRLGFSLLQDEDPDASHITLLGGVFQGASSVLVFSDPLPSMIRRMPPKKLAEVIEGGLPPRSRSRWRGLIQHLSRHGEMNELNGHLLQVHRERRDRIGNSRGAMRAGISASVIEELEQSRRVGLPSRGSRFTVVALDDDDTNGGVADPSSQTPPDESEDLGRATVRLPTRSQEILRLYYEVGLDQAEIGKRLGISQARVSQILKAAYNSLRKHLLS